MQSNYRAVETGTDDLSEAQQQHSSFTENDNQQHCFSLPNPQVHNQYFPLLHHQSLFNDVPQHLLQPQQSQMVNSRHFGLTTTSANRFSERCPQFQPWHNGRGQREAMAHDQSLETKLGLVYSDSSYEHGGVFAHHEVGFHQKFMPKICRQTQEYSAAKQPFWNHNYSVMDDDDISNADKRVSQIDVTRENNIVCHTKEAVLESQQNMSLYGELESIYGLTAMNNNVYAREASHNQTGSSSALSNETSLAAEPNLPDPAKKKRKRKAKEALFRSTARFFESLVESVAAHQDRLHGSFLEAVERIDRERSEREEARRREEARARDGEAVSRAREQALASDRDGLIISYLERIAGRRAELRRGEISAGELS